MLANKQMRTPTLPEFKQWSRDNRGLALAVCKATAYAETMREAVDKIQRAILAEIPLYDDMMAEHNGTERQRITDPRLTYLSKDEPAWQRYFAECNIRERAAGLKPADMIDDYCPALVAEDLQSKAERALLDSGGALCGFSAADLYGDMREKGLRLFLGAALNSPE